MASVNTNIYTKENVFHINLEYILCFRKFLMYTKLFNPKMHLIRLEKSCLGCKELNAKIKKTLFTINYA